MPATGLNETVDWIIPVVYLLAVMVIGWRVGRNTNTQEQLFLAGRSLGFGVIGLSLFASNISSTTLIGLAGAAYSTGIAVASYEWMAALVLLFAAVVLVPVYLRSRVNTIPDYLARRFDPRLKRYVGVLMIFLSVIVDTAASLFAGALVLVAGVQSSVDGRLKESALLRALGARRQVVLGTLWIEFLVLGALAGMLGSAGAEAAAWGLQTAVFDMTWTPTLLMWWLGPLLGAIIVGALGVWSCRSVVNTPPVILLREA